jgi:hypothetical protein
LCCLRELVLVPVLALLPVLLLRWTMEGLDVVKLGDRGGRGKGSLEELDVLMGRGAIEWGGGGGIPPPPLLAPETRIILMLYCRSWSILIKLCCSSYSAQCSNRWVERVHLNLISEMPKRGHRYKIRNCKVERPSIQMVIERDCSLWRFDSLLGSGLF